MKPTPDSTTDNFQQIVADLRRELGGAQRELARSRAERDEGLAREAALAEVLGVINASPGDLGPVFDAILEKAHILCRADHGALQIYDDEFFRPAATRGLPEPFDMLECSGCGVTSGFAKMALETRSSTSRAGDAGRTGS
jgi:hypothetical protein